MAKRHAIASFTSVLSNQWDPIGPPAGGLRGPGEELLSTPTKSLVPTERLLAHLEDLPGLYGELVDWLAESTSSQSLILYRPDPLEDLPRGEARRAHPVLVRGELKLPEPLSVDRIRRNESGIADLTHFLLHLESDNRWLGALEGPGELPDFLQQNADSLARILRLGTRMSHLQEDSRHSHWTRSIHGMICEGASYEEVLDRVLETLSEVLGTPEVGFYTPQAHDFELRRALGFDGDEDRTRRMVTHGHLTDLGLMEENFLFEPVSDSDRSNLFIPLRTGDSFLGLLVAFRLEDPPKDFTLVDRHRINDFARLASVAVSNLELSTRLQSRVIHDDLSELKTEEYFRERVNQEVHRGDRYGFPCALLVFDIDEFQAINEEYGRTAGDTVLREMGRMIRNNFRQMDIGCRFQDDRFGVLLPHTRPVDALVAAERFHELMEAPLFSIQGQNISVQISGGLTSYPEDGDDGETLIRKADLAVYEAKQTGRDRIVTTQDLDEEE